MSVISLSLALLLSLSAQGSKGQGSGPPVAAPHKKQAKLPPKRVSPYLPKWAAAPLAVVPGFFVSGTGHALRGDWRGARNLLLLELTGVGVMLAGYLPASMTTYSRDYIGPSAALFVSGVGMILLAKYLDVVGVFAPDGLSGRRDTPSLFAASVGVRHVHDPLMEYDFFSYLGLSASKGPFFLTEELDWALSNENWRSRTTAGVRLPCPLLPQHAECRAVGGFTFHDFRPERFSVMTVELQAGVRMDMGWLSSSTKGAYFDLALGYGLQYVKWPGVASRFDEHQSLLLTRFALGAYLGKGRGEVAFFYDQRHDTFAGGIRVGLSGDGSAGFAGVRGQYRFSTAWGLFAEVAVGNNTSSLVGITYMGPKEEK